MDVTIDSYDLVPSMNERFLKNMHVFFEYNLQSKASQNRFY